MNILFVTVFEVSEQKGGTERTTARISNELRKKGHKCFSLFEKAIGQQFQKTQFDAVFDDCSPSKVKDIINDKKIDRVILEGCFTLISQVIKGCKMSDYSPKLYFVHHFAPACEPYLNDFHALWKQFQYESIAKLKLKAFAKIVLYPVFKPYMDNKFKRLYKLAYSSCDKIVLLSAGYIDEYCKFGNIQNQADKFVSIPNAVSFDEYLPDEKIKNKERIVLIVTRLEETPKKISFAIKVWNEVENDDKLKDWSLKIVGFGDSESDYKKMVKHLGLERVSFEGKQDPISYYKESSLFMMTSMFEGWPMTLGEAQQLGCVPIVFDTTTSFHEIIEQGKNGFLVENGNIFAFYKRMKELMLDSDKRENMALAAIDMSHRFSLDKIVERWEKVLSL